MSRKWSEHFWDQGLRPTTQKILLCQSQNYYDLSLRVPYWNPERKNFKINYEVEKRMHNIK
jgi:hypothetical protein